jgi:hypothetical protein
MNTRPIPLRPDPAALNATALTSLSRAAVASGLAALDTTTRAEDILRRRDWGDDRAARVLTTRAASSPTTMADAVGLTQVGYAFFAALAPLSAGAAVLQRALNVSFDRSASISLPTLAPGIAGFVPEGGPIPTKSFPSTAATITPHKMAALVELSNELLSASNAEVLVQAALTESAAAGLDAVLLDAQPGSATRPAGLRYNVAALTPAAAGVKDQIMVDDAVALGGAVSGFAGEIVFVCANKQAIALNLRSFRTFSYSVFPSAALADGTVIAINLAALVAALGPVQIEARRAVEVVEADPATEAQRARGSAAWDEWFQQKLDERQMDVLARALGQMLGREGLRGELETRCKKLEDAIDELRAGVTNAKAHESGKILDLPNPLRRKSDVA